MQHIKTTGFWSSVLSVLFAVGYCVPQILSELKLIPHPHDLFWLFLPSLFLAPAFLIAMISLHYSVTPSLKVWTAISYAFAILYCADVSLVYFTQLAVVLPVQLKNEVNEMQARLPNH